MTGAVFKVASWMFRLLVCAEQVIEDVFENELEFDKGKKLSLKSAKLLKKLTKLSFFLRDRTLLFS